MELFWDRGYHATSISDLTDVLGILRGSLYKAFPSKHSLLLTTLDRYRIDALDDIRSQLDRPGSALSSLSEVLYSVADSCSGVAGRNGCFIANLTLEMLPHDRVIADRISRHYQQLTDIFEEVLERIELPSGTTVPALAQLIVTTIQGLRVLGKTAPSRQLTRSTVELLLQFMTDRSRLERAQVESAIHIQHLTGGIIE